MASWDSQAPAGRLRGRAGGPLPAARHKGGQGYQGYDRSRLVHEGEPASLGHEAPQERAAADAQVHGGSKGAHGRPPPPRGDAIHHQGHQGGLHQGEGQPVEQGHPQKRHHGTRGG